MERIRNYYEENKDILRNVIIASISTGVISYYLFIVYGYALPDGLCEGLYYYTNADWHLACGRWAVRYFNRFIGNNIVMPLIIVLLYSIFVAISVLILRYEWKLQNKVLLIMIASAMVVTPAAIAHMTFPHVALTFAFSFLLSVLFYCFGKKKCWIYKGISIVCLAGSMGLYQSYVGAAAAMVVLGAVINFVTGKGIRETMKEVYEFFLLGIMGCGLNVLLYKTEIFVRGTYESSRLQAFSISQIFTSLIYSVSNSYREFWNYFNDVSLKRGYLYFLFFMLVMVGIISLLIKMIRKKKYVEVIVSILLLALVPVCMNLIHILIPYNGISLLMRYHYILMIPFGVAIIEQAYQCFSLYVKRIGLFVANSAVLGIIATCVMTANATFEALRISYDAIEVQTGLILTDVYDLDDFIPNVTRIVFAGFPSDKVARDNLQIYNYTIDLTENVAYWEDMNGIKNNRKQYLLNYCGIDGGYFTDEEYYEIVNGDEFVNMPLWPAQGSVRMINDMAVVKLSETPPGYEQR